MKLEQHDLERIAALTLEHYNQRAQDFWEGTRGHDVAQNIAALLRHIEGEPPFAILDLGCGPGRDLKVFAGLGHVAVGLDGAQRFAQMARENSGCEVWLQDLLALDLPPARFDGVYANAVLFHIPSQELPRVLADAALLHALVYNLVDNALRYTPAGGSVSLRLEARGARVELSVCDTGPGIAPELRARVFERFSRVEPAPSGGSGLGLSIVREAAAACGARGTDAPPATVPVRAATPDARLHLLRTEHDDLDAAIAAFAKLGVKVMITELDIDVLPPAMQYRGADISLNVELQPKLNPYVNGLPDSVQQKLAKRYADLFRVFLKHRRTVARVTFWGVTDASSWLNRWPVRGRTSYPLLFGRDGRPVPAFYAVIKVAREASAAE